MPFKYFYINNEISSLKNAVIPLSNIEYAYGFGVYELIKVRNGTAYFVTQHVNRLIKSSIHINLPHNFNINYISNSIQKVISKNEIKSANLKIILLGGKDSQSAQLFITPSNPKFPDRKLYKNGAKTITVAHERLIPQAKTLNMLGSYLAFKKAIEFKCYDALLIDRKNNIIEGTRTNFFAIKNKTIYTQDSKSILEGVTRELILHIARKNNYIIKVSDIKLNELKNYDSAFLSSTSSKIMPIRQIDNFIFPQISDDLKKLLKIFDTYLDECNGKFIS